MIIVMAGIGGLWVLIDQTKKTEASDDTQNGNGETVEYVERATGKLDSPVVIEIYSDFQCPVCKEFHDITEAQLISNYSDKVKIVYKHFPIDSLHPRARIAAEAAEAAGEQGKFLEYTALLFADQANANKWNVEKLTEFAGNIGLDTAKFESSLKSDKYAKIVQQNYDEGVQKGVTGTPSVFVNGVQTADWGYSTLSADIERTLATAEIEAVIEDQVETTPTLQPSIEPTMTVEPTSAN